MERFIQRVLIGMAALLAVAGVAAAFAPDCGNLARLPSSAVYGCANCHVGADATTAPAAADLNVFGQAFQDNGAVWDRTLALADSDGDGCTDGVEMGDADGNGLPDQHQTQQTSNPGVRGDCAASTDETTWGALKSLFNSN